MKIFTRFISFSFIAASIMATTQQASAIDVACQPGELKNVLEKEDCDILTLTSLKVTGSLDASDFDFIREMTALQSLDLSGATIAAYSGTATASGSSTSKPNCLPAYALLSSSVSDFAFPDGITEIGSGALGGSKIKTLVIPATVTKIDTGAFSNMEELTSVTIPSSVTSLPAMLFKNCSRLQSATIDATVTTLPEEFFQDCSLLTAVSLPSSLTAIGNYAFSGCSALTEISLPNGLQSIGDYAFALCSDLQAITTPASLKSIGAWSFSGCDNLRTVTFESPVATFGTGAFYNATDLATPLGDLASNATDLPDYFLYNAANVPADGFGDTAVEKVGTRALSGNQSATVELPSTLNYLGDNAMEDWTSLTRIDAVALDEAPQLGASVWEGVDQANVLLYVPAAIAEQYKDAPQWQDFNISEFAVSETTPADIVADHNLRAAFDGLLLRLEADLDIRAAQLYDISGRCLTIANNYQSNRLTVDTAPYSTSVFLVRVLLADGTTAVLKLAR